MLKYWLLLVSVIFSSFSFASVDIELACEEKKEQQLSLLSKMSTSVLEAHLAGQCTGYNSLYQVDLGEACSEFVEQKEALLSSMSTSLSEANLAGICVGAIHKLASKKCKDTAFTIDYLSMAKEAIKESSVYSVKKQINCSGVNNGW